MTDLTKTSWQEPEMIALSHLTELDESLKDWERYQRYSLEDLRKDRDKRNMVLHAMLISIQAAIDISSHLISKNQLKRPALFIYPDSCSAWSSLRRIKRNGCWT